MQLKATLSILISSIELTLKSTSRTREAIKENICMIKTALLIFLTLVSVVAVFPQNITDLENWWLKGKVRQINSYDIYSSENPKNNDLQTRKLRNIDIFNRQGNLDFQYAFGGNGSECYYTETIYSYDQLNRKKEVRVVESGKSDSFCVKEPSAFIQRAPAYSDLKPNLKKRKTFTYNRLGKLFKQLIYNSSNVLVEEIRYQYNRLGMRTRLTIAQTGNKKKESRTKWESNGRRSTSYLFEDDKLISREELFYDSERRLVRAEMFRLKTDGKNRILREIPGDSTKSYFEGDVEILDWTMRDENGLFNSKLFILRKNDNEVLRFSYTLDPKRSGEKLSHYRSDSALSAEENDLLKKLLKYDELVDKPDWIPTEREIKSYKFDQAGNFIRTIMVLQDNPQKAQKSKSEYEREIFYFQ